MNTSPNFLPKYSAHGTISVAELQLCCLTAATFSLYIPQVNNLSRENIKRRNRICALTLMTHSCHTSYSFASISILSYS